LEVPARVIMVDRSKAQTDTGPAKRDDIHDPS